MSLGLLLHHFKLINTILAEYEQQFEVLAKTQHHEKPVRALTCYKPIKSIFALTMITEIGDQGPVFTEP